MGVLVVGNTTLDLIDGAVPRAGGAPRYAAEALAALGHEAVVVTGVAPADRALVSAARHAGVRIVDRPLAETPVFRLDHSGDGRTITIERTGSPWTAADVAEWVAPHAAASCWIQVGALSRTDFDAAALHALRRLGPVGLDGQGLTRPGRTGAVRLDACYDPRCLEAVTVLKLAEDEAAALGGLERLVGLGVPELLVTLGERGALVVVAGEHVSVPADPVPGVDGTGSGDRFLAAYLAGRDSGLEPPDAARGAARVVHDLLAARR